MSSRINAIHNYHLIIRPLLRRGDIRLGNVTFSLQDGNVCHDIPTVSWDIVAVSNDLTNEIQTALLIARELRAACEFVAGN